MTTTCPNVADTGKYSIKQAAQALGISLACAYNYCNSGMMKYGARRTNGARFVTGREIKRVWNAEY